MPAAETYVRFALSVSVTVMSPPPCPAGSPPFRRGVSVYVTLLPTPTVVGAADLVIWTSENPPLTVVFAVTVLLAGLPSGSGELTVNAAVIVPPTLATAGTVRLGALAPEASDVLRVQVMVCPAHSG